MSPPHQLPLRVHPRAARSLGPFPQGLDCPSMGLLVAASGSVQPMRSPGSKWEGREGGHVFIRQPPPCRATWDWLCPGGPSSFPLLFLPRPSG